MKVNIWIKKEDVKKGIITEYHTNQPQVSYSSYVQVSISADEFTRLEDSRIDKESHEGQLSFGFISDTECNYTVSIDGPGIEYNNIK